MVCTFMLIVLPSLALKGMFRFFCWLTGYKPAQKKQAQAQAEGAANQEQNAEQEQQ